MLGKQVALQEKSAVFVWELFASAGLGHAVVGQNWQWLKLRIGFFPPKTIKSLWLFKGISVFHNSGRNIMAAQAENSQPVVQLEVVGIPVKTFRNAVLSRETAHCIFLWVNQASMNNIVWEGERLSFFFIPSRARPLPLCAFGIGHWSKLRLHGLTLIPGNS